MGLVSWTAAKAAAGAYRVYASNQLPGWRGECAIIVGSILAILGQLDPRPIGRMQEQAAPARSDD